jgi:hypothetical protein
VTAEPARGGGGRPVLGAISGLLFGLFLTVDLLFLSVFTLSSVMVLLLPVVFLVAGIILGLVAPLRFLRRGGGA